MNEAAPTPRKYSHAIVYWGAPYGENERGHIVSRHTSEDLAEAAYDRRFGGTTGVLNNRIVELDSSGDYNPWRD